MIRFYNLTIQIQNSMDKNNLQVKQKSHGIAKPKFIRLSKLAYSILFIVILTPLIINATAFTAQNTGTILNDSLITIIDEQLRKNPDSALYYYNRIVRQAEIYESSGKSESAAFLYKKAIDFFEERNESILAGSTYLKLGQLYMFIDDNEAALKTLFKAEEKLDDSGEFKTLGQLYENIAEINVALGYEDKVIHYTKKAIECFRKLDDPSYLAAAYAQIGVSYKVQEKYDTALWYYNKSVEIAKNRSAHQLLAQNYMNMANVHDLTGNRKTAMEYHQKSIEICREHDIPYGIYLNYINLAEINLQEENYEEATVFLNDALELANEKGYGNRIPLFENLFYAAKQTGQYKKAVEYFEKAYQLKDSLHEAQKHKELMELQTRHETKEKEAEILKLNNKDQRNALVRAYLIIAFVSVLIVGIAILFFLRRKIYMARQRTLKLENENERKKEHIEKVSLEKKLHQEEAERYRLDLEMKEQELVFQTLREAGIKQINQSVKKNLAPFAYKMTRKKDKEEFSDRLDQIAREASRDPLCEFEQMFLQMHDGFYEKLLEKAPDLSNSELQMCALLRMNLPSKEIASLLNLALSTVDQRRYNIRKKINLDNQKNLVSFLISL